MTEQEKELVSFLYTLPEEKDGYGGSQLNCEESAKALIQRYPQILAEKVWEGEAKFLKALYKNNDSDFVFHNYPSNENKNIEVFIREIKE